ncbi:hypothetical protein GOZ96_04730 [Agrobacterium vitis]|uniref:Tail tubular protein A n=1 Tax=Agrobacterium vitis TaxID=373 RepID=A0A7J4X550_AGRVI|nr:hypothetical protein [Agrobacterium vitis]KAA3527049.1 hypothetical protein DXT89_14030 [Agrobacterium vitis]MUZ95894.1 hypothetical protein [Agrobacterium vitis]
MADKLSLYREALRHIGAERLASLTEARPERVLLDDVWDSTVRTVLTEGLWNFATRTVLLDYDEDIDVQLGFEYGFSKPTDCIRTTGMSENGSFNDGLEDWKDENAYIYANITSIYLQYVSDDVNYGLNVGVWSEQFSRAVAAHLSYQIALPVTSSENTRNTMWQMYKRLLKDAKALDASEDRVRRAPAGRLVKARFASRVSSSDRGMY